MERQSSRLLLDTESIEKLRHHWQEYILGLEKTPTELLLSKARADRALELARSNQNRRLEQASSPSKCVRFLKALYSAPRKTCRMRKILNRQPTKIEEPRDESYYCICPQCGLVRDHCLTHKRHAERLNTLLAQHPNLLPNSQRL